MTSPSPQIFGKALVAYATWEGGWHFKLFGVLLSVVLHVGIITLLSVSMATFTRNSILVELVLMPSALQKHDSIADPTSGQAAGVLNQDLKPADQEIMVDSELPSVRRYANEAGQDQLKHGSEARFMHGIATEEFVEENYVGAYAINGEVVRIIDDRAVSGHLILEDSRTGFRRTLYRFNRFIYVYGHGSESPEPIVGSLIFLSDGQKIHQFIWEYNDTTVYYPRR